MSQLIYKISYLLIYILFLVKNVHEIKLFKYIYNIKINKFCLLFIYYIK